MRVVVLQSNYIPWRGYFDLVDDADLFVLYDDVQFTKNDWRNRNRIKVRGGDSAWLTVPVRHASLSQLICETAIDEAQPWRRKHLGAIGSNYSHAPYLDKYWSGLQAAMSRNYSSLSSLNRALIEWIAAELGITTPIRWSHEFRAEGRKTERLVGILRSAGATSYLSGPRGAEYLDEELLRNAGVRLEYKEYDYPEYPQLWGSFDPRVSVIDLLFNCGDASRELIKSRSPNREARGEAAAPGG